MGMDLFSSIFGGKKTPGEERREIMRSTDVHANESGQRDSEGGGGYAVVRVNDVFNIAGVGTVPVVTVVEGLLLHGMKANVTGKIATIESIEAKHKVLNSAGPGQNVGLKLSGVSKGDIFPGSQLRFVR